MWFAARVLFESTVAHDDGRVLREESIRLIQANDEMQARSKATTLGIADQHHFPNHQGELVDWQFVCVLEVQDLAEENVFDGMEVYSRLEWSEKEKVENKGDAPHF